MIVTGASSGIGRALAERAVRAGWDVFALGRRGQRLEELKSTVAGATGRIASAALDVRTPGAPARIVREARERFGRIDVVVNNAGVVAVGPIGTQRDEALREQFETHAIVPLALTREALDELKRTRGQVVLIGSGVARIPIAGLGAYPPAKAAVRNVARILRNELRPFGIVVTYVDPGAVATEFMTRAGFVGPPKKMAASPQSVARKIFDAIEHRHSVVNAVPWQTAFLGLGELLPSFTDWLIARVPDITGAKLVSKPKDDTPTPSTKAETVPAIESQPARSPHEPALPPHEPALPPLEPTLPPFEAALEPVAQRMRRLNLSVDFVRSLLVPDAELDASEVALRWAGMPNKHERAVTSEVLDALALAGYLERIDPDRYRVLRSA